MSLDLAEHKSLLSKQQIEHVQIDANLKQISSTHEEILKHVSKLLTRSFYVLFSYSFTYSMRTYILVLYCKTFENYNGTIVSIAIYFSYFMSGAVALLFGIIGDRWRFDYMFILASILDVITFFIEASTTNINILLIAYVLGAQPSNAIVNGFANHHLPITYQKNNYAITVSLYLIGIVTGPIVGGIIGIYFGYRSVFYIAAITGLILFVYVLYHFWNVEQTIKDKQLSMKKYYDKKMVYNDKQNVISTRNNSDEIDENQELAMNTHELAELKEQLSVELLDEHARWIISDEFRFPICLQKAQTVC